MRNWFFPFFSLENRSIIRKFESPLHKWKNQVSSASKKLIIVMICKKKNANEMPHTSQQQYVRAFGDKKLISRRIYIPIKSSIPNAQNALFHSFRMHQRAFPRIFVMQQIHI